MVFAQIALVSPHLLQAPFIGVITSLMQDFLSTAKHLDIKEYEEDQVCVWSTLLPYLKLFYLPHTDVATLLQKVVCQRVPDSNPSQTMAKDIYSELLIELKESCVDEQNQPVCFKTDVAPAPETSVSLMSLSKEDINSLQQLSSEMVLHFLHTKMASDHHCNVLVEEKLIDYVTCLPWHVRTVFKCKAEEVVSELKCHVRLQPPKLMSLARAVLARMCFGLEKAISVDSPMELARELWEIQ